MNPAHELSALIEALRALRRVGDTQAALATITRTRGATFRRVGTRMLVHADGRVVCELSGGCPQHDIVLRAQEAIASGEPRLARYNAESGLDLLMEMGCGGELEILIEPLTQRDASDFIEPLSQCLEQRRQAWMATWFARDGEAIVPRRLLWPDDALPNEAALYDRLGDETLGRVIRETSRRHPSTRAITVELRTSAQSHTRHSREGGNPGNGAIDVAVVHAPRTCAGMTAISEFPLVTAEVLIEPVLPPHALVVIGCGAVARALLPLAAALGWQGTLVDPDPERLRQLDAPSSSRLVCATPGALCASLALDPYTSVVLATHNLEQDIAYLAALRDAPLAYLGALGSRDRAARVGAHHAAFDGPALHAPAGLDIGAETPTEIALAIAAEIMAVINRRAGGALCESDGSIHP